MTIGRLKGVLRVAVVLLVIAFWGAYLWRNWDSFLTYHWEIDYSLMLAGCLVAVAFWIALALIWQRALLLAGGSLGIGTAIRVYAISMLGRYVPGGVWHIASRVYMAEKAGESGVAVFVSTVVEQVLGLLGGFLLLLVSLPFWNPEYSRLSPVLVLIVPLAITVHPAVLRRLATLATRLRRKSRASTIDGLSPTEQLMDESGPIPGYWALLGLLMLYGLANLTAAATAYLSAAALGPVSLDQLPAFAGAYAVGYVLGYFSFLAPSGLGVREGAIALLLTPVVGAPVAVAASALSRLTLSIGEAAVVGVCWGLRDRQVERSVVQE